MRNAIIFLFCFMLAICTIPVLGDELPSITLTEGKNEVFISVKNEGASAVTGLEVVVNKDDLPLGVQFLETEQRLDIPEKSQGRIPLSILVGDGLSIETFELPLLLRDTKGQEWNFRILAQVEGIYPMSFRLMQNEPNPFNSGTTIRYDLASQAVEHTILTIYNVMGQRVRTLVDEPQKSGSYAVKWDGRDDHGQKLSSGVYIYRLQSGNTVSVRKMLFVE